MSTSPHAHNAATAPNTENKTSVRQLLDGQEYLVAKVEIYAWPTSVAFPNFMAVLDIPVT